MNFPLYQVKLSKALSAKLNFANFINKVKL